MSDGINLCFADMMHQCSFDDGKKHKHCTFYEKNRFMDICSGFRKGSFCQCQEAYPTAKTIPVKEADLPKLSRGEGEGEVKNYIDGVPVRKAAGSLVEDRKGMIGKCLDSGKLLDRYPIPCDSWKIFDRSPVRDAWDVNDWVIKDKNIGGFKFEDYQKELTFMLRTIVERHGFNYNIAHVNIYYSSEKQLYTVNTSFALPADITLRHVTTYHQNGALKEEIANFIIEEIRQKI